MDDVARVVLALEAPQVAEEVLSYLDRSGLARVVATAADDRQLEDAVRQTEPDLVIAQPSLAGAVRGTDVVTLDGRESVGGLRAALDAGALGFFVWPGDRERLLGLVARRGPRRGRSRPRGLIVAVRGSRGGAGATFVTSHLAAALARSGSSCLIVDGDPVADDLRSCIGAPIDGPQTLSELLPIADRLNAAQVADAAWQHPAGFGVVFGFDPTGRMSADAFGSLLEAAASGADVVVVHLGKALDEASLAAMRQADRVLHVLTLDAVSFRAADRTLEALSHLGLAARSAFVVNRASRSEIHPGDVRRVFGVDAMAVLPASRGVEQAQSRGKLLTGRGRISRAFDRLSVRVREDLREMAA